VYESDSSEVEAHLEAFYRDILWALEEFGRRKGATPLGWRPAEWWGLSMQSSAAISQRT